MPTLRTLGIRVGWAIVLGLVAAIVVWEVQVWPWVSLAAFGATIAIVVVYGMWVGSFDRQARQARAHRQAMSDVPTTGVASVTPQEPTTAPK